LRHRAVLFGLLAAFLAYAAFQPALHGLAIIAGLVSVVSFIVLAHLGGQAPGALNAALMRVVRVDYAAVVLLAVASVAHVARMRAA
jgi:acetaldehyde dehydrogenase (acetylating)